MMQRILIVLCVTWTAYSQTGLQHMLDNLGRILPHMFAHLDGNHDGSMTHNEFNAFIISADGNGDGCMSRTEYVSASATGSSTATRVFNHLDPTHTGCLTPASLNGAYLSMDTNGDGEVNEQELGAWFTKVLTESFASTTGPVGINSAIQLPGGEHMDRLIHTTFGKFDRNGDGTFHHSEFNAFITSSDTNTDGCMSRKEYIASSGTNSATATEIFKRFDAMGNNCLRPSNLNAAFGSMDLNGDGGVTEHEFDSWFTGVLTQIFG